ncbi:MAG: ABC transporter permease [Clostridium sp.]|nr:ABC transporter permease [Clostridium sp.]MCM1399724.1 ABC transporter permease [Clostridium sp.]MCM1460441.1 ABC transporter permease [Bacteroides sp.]
MNVRIIKSLYKKEMLDVLRDKKTVVMMLVVPLVLYPLVMICSLFVMTGITNSISSSTYRICLDFEDDGHVEELFQNTDEVSYSFELVACENPNEALANEEVDAIIRRTVEEGRERFDITYMSSINNSAYAVDMIEKTLNSYSHDLTVGILEDAGLDPQYTLTPVDIHYRDVSTNEETAGSLLGMLIPFMLVMSLLMGTMYPAIDTTAGEKERGTLETMLTLPVSNSELIMSKFLAVGTIGVTSAVLNLISMGGVGAYMYNMVATIRESTGGLNMSRFIPAIFVGTLCILAFAVFISAISMCVCALARSYKEANNYLTPLTLVVMFASFLSFIPNVALNTSTALIPVANVCLLVRDLLLFKYNIQMIVLVLFVNVAYGLVSVMLLSKIYNSEAVIFGDGSGGIQIFEKRSNLKKGMLPTTQDAWLVIIFTAMLVIYAGGAAQLKYGIYGLLITQLIVVGIPLIATIYTKKDIKKTFKLKGCSPRYFVGGIFVITGGIMLGMLVSAVTGLIFKESALDASESMAQIIGDSFPLALIIVALAPAICEELMFRGYVLGAMSGKYNERTAVIISAVIFGIYHMSVSKFFTTALIGGLICYVAVRSKSILPGMLMHFTNNALSVVTMFYQEETVKVFPVFAKETLAMSDILIMLGLGIFFVAVGVFIVKSNKKICKA